MSLLPSLALPLTAQDRCDSCPAQAHERVVFSQSELLFCEHHYRKHLGAIGKLNHVGVYGGDGQPVLFLNEAI